MSRSNAVLRDDEIEEKVLEFQQWIRTQPHLPQNLDKLLLARYLKIYSFRLERAQRLLSDGMVFRKNNPWFFSQRDPTTPEMELVVKTVDMVPLLEHTKENYKVCVYRLLNDDANNIVFNDCIKAFFMGCDVRFAVPLANYSDIESGEVIIFDMKNMTFKHLLKISIPTLRLYFKYLQEAHPVRIIQLHVINCTPLIHRAMAVIKPFIYAKLYNAMKFHDAGSMDSLYEFVPREILPANYGGDAETMEELKQHWVEVLDQHTDFLLNDKYFALNEDETKAESGDDKQKFGSLFRFLLP